MKTVLIIIGIILYVSIGACIAAVEEANRFDTTGEYGLRPIIYLFWPIYIVICWIKDFIKRIKEKNNGKSM